MAFARLPDRRPVRRIAASAVALALGGLALAEVPAAAASKPIGNDVSSYQGNINWGSVHGKGGRFAYVKATESTNYRNPYFAQQYNGAYKAGMLRGAYHFALPNKSSGKTQAAYFVRHGGGWSADGKTLPPALDIEHNPYSGGSCYGKSAAGMVSWIKSFSDEVNRRTGRRPAIYTSTQWWNTCTGHSRAFAAQHPLWLARYGSSPGPLPAGWTFWTFWQYNDHGKLPGDQDKFNGSMTQLRRLAKG
ncbi:lysozyme [Streptomyces sp. NPDC058045]|uniref:lysozyme n=1 Tax=Streptomyces sp. NPDC058045 TaxID=3346311 RepID=UPI0036EF1460